MISEFLKVIFGNMGGHCWYLKDRSWFWWFQVNKRSQGAEISETVCYIPLLGDSAVMGPCWKLGALSSIPSTPGMWRRDRSAFIREHGLPNFLSFCGLIVIVLDMNNLDSFLLILCPEWRKSRGEKCARQDCKVMFRNKSMQIFNPVEMKS